MKIQQKQLKKQKGEVFTKEEIELIDESEDTEYQDKYQLKEYESEDLP